jgi:hypothetical protein
LSTLPKGLCQTSFFFRIIFSHPTLERQLEHNFKKQYKMSVSQATSEQKATATGLWDAPRSRSQSVSTRHPKCSRTKKTRQPGFTARIDVCHGCQNIAPHHNSWSQSPLGTLVSSFF